MSVIGLDIGTTNIRVSVFQHGQVQIITDDEGIGSIPNCVAFTETGRLFGTEAKEQATINLTNTVTNAMRIIGRRPDDRYLELDQRYWPFHISDGKILVNMMGRKQWIFSLEVLSMMIRKMLYLVADHLGTAISDAVITVPAGFNYEQLQTIRDACVIANLNVIGITNGPTAAALACIQQKLFREAYSNVLVFHLGGGTCDILIICIQDNVVRKQCIRCDLHLGGEDITNRMVSYFIREFKRMHKIELQAIRRSVHLLRTACEQAKRELTISDQTTLNINSLYADVDFSTNITRAQFEEINAGLFSRMLNLVEKALADANLDRKSIDDIVLVGGSTAIPKIRALLQEYFDGKPLNTSVDPNETVVYGAAIRAAMLGGCKHETIDSIVFPEVCTRCYGFQFIDNTITTVIHRNTTIPTEAKLPRWASAEVGFNPWIHLYEYEDKFAVDIIELTRVDFQELLKLSPDKSESRCFQFEFYLDSKMQLNVSVLDVHTGIRKVKVIGGSNLTYKDILLLRGNETVFQQNELIEQHRSSVIHSRNNYLNQIKRLVANERIKAKLSDSAQKALLKIIGETSQSIRTNIDGALDGFTSKENELR